MPSPDGQKRRRAPRQRRSRQTVDAILEAAARVFAERGHRGATTNHIAERAGVSVGSLYEYFPNKDALLVAVVERQLEAMMAEVRDHLSTGWVPDEPLDAVLRRFVCAMLEIHEREPDLYRVAFGEARPPAELHACVLEMEDALAHSLAERLQGQRGLGLVDCDVQAHFVFQTAEALTHRFVHTGIHDLARADFVEEVVRLLAAYLTAAASSGADS